MEQEKLLWEWNFFFFNGKASSFESSSLPFIKETEENGRLECHDARILQNRQRVMSYHILHFLCVNSCPCSIHGVSMLYLGIVA